MNHYIITRANGKPDWENIPVLEVTNQQWMPEVDIQTKFQICYNEDGLHLHMRSWEKNIRAEWNEPLSMACEDSCMEFFFRPMDGDLRYFNVETNPNGRMYIGFGPNMPNLVRLVPQEEDTFFRKEVSYVPGGWEVYFTFPASMIRVFFPEFTLEPGRKIYANCYKCGDLTIQPHFISWNPINSETPNFHRPQDFGLMELG